MGANFTSLQPNQIFSFSCVHSVKDWRIHTGIHIWCLIHLQVSIFVCFCGLNLNRRLEKSDLISLDVCVFFLGTKRRFWLSGWDSCILFDPYFMKRVSQSLLILVQATGPECCGAEMLFYSFSLCCWMRLKEIFHDWLVLYCFIFNSKQTVSWLLVSTETLFVHWLDVLNKNLLDRFHLNL